MHDHPALHDVSPGQSELTKKMTAGVDVTGRPSLVEDCQRGRLAHSRSTMLNTASMSIMTSALYYKVSYLLTYIDTRYINVEKNCSLYTH